MRFTNDILSEYEALCQSRNYTDKLRAAALEKEWEGDTEIAEKLKTLSAQLEFAGPDDEDDDAILQTRKELSAMIDARNPFVNLAYHRYLSDQDILDSSSGEVTSSDDYDPYRLTFKLGGLHDPNIFGGNGQIPVADDSRRLNLYRDTEGRGLSIGHIMLPMHCISYSDKSQICKLLEIPDILFDEIMKGHAWLDTTDNTFYRFEQISGHFRAPNILGYGDAIHYMLVRLNLPDHPERFAFRVLPVLGAAVRPCYMDPGTLDMNACEIDDRYKSIINRVNRIKKLTDLDAPSIILMNELRLLQESVSTLIDSRFIKTDDEDKPLSLCNMLEYAYKHRVRPWALGSVITAMHMRSLGYEIPVLKGRDIKPQLRTELCGTVILESDNTQTAVPISEVLDTMEAEMNDLLEQMYEIEDRVNTSEEADAADEAAYNNLRDTYRAYGERVDKIHVQAMAGLPVRVVKDNNIYDVISENPKFDTGENV